MLDLFSSYMSTQESTSEDLDNSTGYPDWILDPSFFFNRYQDNITTKDFKKRRVVKTNDHGKNAYLKNNAILPKVNFETGRKEIPKSTVEKVSPAFRLIKEAFNELQLFTRVCK